MDYSPSPIPNDVNDLPRYLQEEFRRMADIVRESPARKIEFRNVAPTKPREGMLSGADGTNWNPGGGKGVYCYYGGAWTKL